MRQGEDYSPGDKRIHSSTFNEERGKKDEKRRNNKKIKIVSKITPSYSR